LTSPLLPPSNAARTAALEEYQAQQAALSQQREELLQSIWALLTTDKYLTDALSLRETLEELGLYEQADLLMLCEEEEAIGLDVTQGVPLGVAQGAQQGINSNMEIWQSLAKYLKLVPRKNMLVLVNRLQALPKLALEIEREIEAITTTVAFDGNLGFDTV
jgi:hypothetical protein